MGDWITCFVMGIIGFVMKRGGWPRPPLILALILGNIMENSFQISMRVHDGWGWVTRPIIVIIIVLLVSALAVFQSGNLVLGLGITAGFIVAFLFLAGTARLIMTTVKRNFPTSWQYVWRQGLANLYRPNNQTSILMLALGLGLAESRRHQAENADRSEVHQQHDE